MTRKKVVLFIVEGITERESLELLLTELINDDSQIIFEVVGGDITSDKYIRREKILKKIEELIEDGGKRKFKPSDYSEIIHLVDTDAVFISEENIYRNNRLNKLVYKEDGIYTKYVKSVVERNKIKKEVLNFLLTINKVYGTVPYRMFYFSCNLEHVLHDEIQVNSRSKVRYAEDFQDRYIDDLESFIDFICNSDFSVKERYKESWAFIKKNNNSIKRYTNFNILLEDYVNE
ncbi:MAG: hypothetical protein ACTHW2_01275 [Tissierella sp.]|uniref:hypothetical protein n=1 Tax=Tissierella sp. TaxID=41274 RepID=UPI003F99582E